MILYITMFTMQRILSFTTLNSNFLDRALQVLTLPLNCGIKHLKKASSTTNTWERASHLGIAVLEIGAITIGAGCYFKSGKFAIPACLFVLSILSTTCEVCWPSIIKITNSMQTQLLTTQTNSQKNPLNEILNQTQTEDSGQLVFFNECLLTIRTAKEKFKKTLESAAKLLEEEISNMEFLKEDSLIAQLIAEESEERKIQEIYTLLTEIKELETIAKNSLHLIDKAPLLNRSEYSTANRGSSPCLQREKPLNGNASQPKTQNPQQPNRANNTLIPQELKDRYKLIDIIAPIGIRNHSGSDCFLNSMIQFMIHIPELRSIISNKIADNSELTQVYNGKSVEEQKTDRKQFMENLSQLLFQYYNLLKEQFRQTNSNETLDPSLFRKSLLNKELLTGENDAGEMFFEIFKIFKTKHLQVKFTILKKYDSESRQEASYKDPLLATNHINKTYDHEFPFLLSVPNEENPTLKSCIKNALKDEFCQTYLYYKESTDQKTYKAKCKKETEIFSLPNHLFFSFKRAKFNSKKNSYEKNMTKVSIPTLFDYGENHSFELKAFIRHQGSEQNTGHWITYVQKEKLSKEKKYYALSDSEVKEISENNFTLMASSADLFYYSALKKETSINRIHPTTLLTPAD